MHQIGPGTLIAGRYAVSHRIQQHPRWERWAAQDTPSGRSVVVLAFPGDTPAAAAAIDAARRAAGVADPRLVRVLDVVPGDGDTGTATVSAIIEEPVERAQTLTRILGQGGLPADEARRITGETATALEAAAARGLRHIVLTPRNVLILPDGSVRVRGVAVEAALLGLEETPAAVASRLDARALVGIGYAALTGRWPLTGPDSGLPSAPRVGSAVVAADELAADVCPDLDRLARLTLIEGAGPITATEVRSALRPWASSPTIDLWGDRAAGGAPDRGVTVRTGASNAVGAPTATGASGGDGSSTGPTGVRSGDGAPGRSGGPSSTGSSSETLAGQGVSGHSGRVDKNDSGGGAGTDAPASAAASTGANAGAAAAAVTAAVARGVRGFGSALGAAGAAAAAATTRIGERARHTAGRVSARGESATLDAGVGADSPAPMPDGPPAGEGGPESVGLQRERRGRGDGTRSAADSTRLNVLARPHRQPEFYLEDATLAAVLAGGQAPLEDPVPLVPSPGEMGRGESRLALMIVAGLVVFLALLGIWGLPRLSVATPSARPAASATGSVGASSATGAATGGVQTPLTPVAITGAAMLDATSGQVNSSSAGRAHDGKADTMWRSGWYASDKFGGLNVPGVGLILDLGQQTEVRQVAVTLPVAQDVTVYLANRASVEGATVVGSSAGRTGTLVFDLPAGPVASGQLVIVFVTKLGPDGSGRFRAQVAEVAVSR